VLPFDLMFTGDDSSSNFNKLARISRIGKVYKLVRMTKLARIIKIIKVQDAKVSQCQIDLLD
jgi:hypothetical protein